MKRSKPVQRSLFLDRRFYVASQNVVGDNDNARAGGREWRKATLEEATSHGQRLMEREDHEEVYIVEVVRILRRKAPPIEVIDL